MSPNAGTADPAGRYQLVSRIATGGMGEVWRATDTVLHRPVAVKLLKPEYADDPAFRARFETEARHAAALHHPGIASVFDFGDSTQAGEHRPYLVMELVEGQPLSALLRKGQPMPADRAVELLVQVADALAVAHKAGIVHRDVKPANLIVTPDRTVKVTDFGIARAADGVALTQTGQVMGTPQYLSPEQAEGRTATAASDVYSLGCVLFECLAGERAFDEESPVATALAHLRKPAPELPARVPADIAAVVRRCLAKDPRDRYRDAGALAVALRNPSKAAPAAAAVAPGPAQTAVLGGLPPARQDTRVGRMDHPVTVPGARYDEPQRSGGISPAWLLIPLLLLLLLVGWTWWQGREEDPTPPSADPTTSATVETSTTEEFVSFPAEICTDTDIEGVRQAIRDRGLNINEVPLENDGTHTEGDVESCNPTGENLSQDEVITVEYYGPAPEPTDTTPTEPTDTATATETTATDTGLIDPNLGGN